MVLVLSLAFALNTGAVQARSASVAPTAPSASATTGQGEEARIPATAGAQNRLQTSDLLKLRSVNGVVLSPDGTRVAYGVEDAENDESLWSLRALR